LRLLRQGSYQQGYLGDWAAQGRGRPRWFSGGPAEV